MSLKFGIWNYNSEAHHFIGNIFEQELEQVRDSGYFYFNSSLMAKLDDLKQDESVQFSAQKSQNGEQYQRAAFSNALEAQSTSCVNSRLFGQDTERATLDEKGSEYV